MFLQFDEPKRDLLANCHSFWVMTARSYEFVQLDVFTRTPLTGNPPGRFHRHTWDSRTEGGPARPAFLSDRY